MEVTKTTLGVYLIKIDKHYDERGFFNQLFQDEAYNKAGINQNFPQDNLSYSRYGTTRGLHYQEEPFSQGKLIQVVRGKIFDVCVNIDKKSKDFGKQETFYLNTDSQIFIPSNFAHGFQCLTEEAYVIYKCTNVYSKTHEKTIIWNDPDLSVNWPIKMATVSDKDKLGLSFKAI